MNISDLTKLQDCRFAGKKEIVKGKTPSGYDDSIYNDQFKNSPTIGQMPEVSAGLQSFIII